MGNHVALFTLTDEQYKAILAGTNPQLLEEVKKKIKQQVGVVMPVDSTLVNHEICGDRMLLVIRAHGHNRTATVPCRPGLFQVF